VDQIDKATVIDVHLPYAGTYTIEFWRMPSIGTDIEYNLNGTLSHDEPAIFYVSPLNVTVGTPTAFTGYAPSAEGWTYYWEFGPGASPQTASVHVPTVTFNTPGMHTCKLSISNGGPVTSKEFIVNVDEWQRQYVAFLDSPDRCNSSLVYKESGELNLCVSGGMRYRLVGGQWVRGADFPSSIYIYDTSITSDASDNLVICDPWFPALTLYRESGNTWTGEVVDPDDDSYEIYSSIVRGSQGFLNAFYMVQGESSHDLMCARETPTGWDLHNVGGYDFSTYTSIATDSIGNPWISYIPEQYDGTLFHLARWDGAQWVDETAPLDISDRRVARNTLLYFDAADNPHVMFETPSPSEIHHVWRDTEWHGETAMGVNGDAWKSCWSLEKDSLDQPWMLIYSFKTLDSERADMGLLRQNGGEWMYEPVVYQNVYSALGDLALDANDKPHISYVDTDTRSVMHLWRD
jgi:hypothetical protein